jgi:hypothetical protein
MGESMNYKAKRSNLATPSPLNGERAGVRGECIEKVSIGETPPASNRPHLTLTLSPPSGSEEGNHAGRLWPILPRTPS